MKSSLNLQTNVPQETKVFIDDKTNPFISNGTQIKVRLKGINRNKGECL